MKSSFNWSIAAEVNWTGKTRATAWLDSLYGFPELEYRRVNLERLAGPKKRWGTWFENATESQLLEFAEFAFDVTGVEGMRVVAYLLPEESDPVYHIMISVDVDFGDGPYKDRPDNIFINKPSSPDGGSLMY